MDYGHKQSDKMLKDLEKRLQKEYAQAEKEVFDKLIKYLQAFERKNAKKLAEVASGKITEKEYNNWRVNQMLVGKRWEEMQKSLAQDLHHTNEIARDMIKTHTQDVYALNHNFGTYEVEKGAMVDTSYTLYNRSSVERMMRDNPQMLPPPGKYISQRIAEGKDVKWNEQQIQSVMMQGILQGESMPNIAKRLVGQFGESYTEDIIKDKERKTAKEIAKELARKNKTAALRNARTMTTGAENAGREDSYKRAVDMGVKMKQMWVATLDERTRHEHRLLDGQIREVGKPFEVGGQKIDFPGQPTADPHLVYNCRCGLIAVVKGSAIDKEGAEALPRRSKLGDMTYDEWKNEHEEAKPKPKPEEKKKPKKEQEQEQKPKKEKKPEELHMKEENKHIYETLKTNLDNKKIEQLEVQTLKKQLTSDEIIKKLAGGDQTQGSCASLCFAYAGNTHGLDVIDFRGGNSQDMFSMVYNIEATLTTANANVVTYKVKKEAADTAKLLKQLPQDGKEYMLSAGKHAAIIRHTKDAGLEYLEMQSPTKNGWKPFEWTRKSELTGITYKKTVEETLYNRFGCRKTVDSMKLYDGSKIVFEKTIRIIEVDSFEPTEEFKDILSFINTEVDKQMKGVSGHER